MVRAAAIIALLFLGGWETSHQQALAEERGRLAQAEALLREADATADPLQRLAILNRVQPLLDANRAEEAAAHPERRLPNQELGGQTDQPVYSAGQCVGPIIMGVCQGSTIGPPQATCHGEMLNGQCTGPMF